MGRWGLEKPLKEICSSAMNFENRSWEVQELIDNGAWKYEMIGHLLPKGRATTIIFMHIPKFANVADKCSWPDGEATIRSIYKLLSEKEVPK